MKKRTRARELALQFLYQVDLLGEESASDLNAFLREEETDVETCKFARRLVQGSTENKQKIDDEISSVAQNWHITRMAVIDRNVLRLATFELLHCDDIPPKVAINEAIELGKRFSTENSGAFINGILDRIKSKAKAAKEESGTAEPSATPEAVADEPAEEAPMEPTPWDSSRLTPGTEDGQE